MTDTQVAGSDAATLAGLLRFFRVRAGLTQEMLAERAGVSLATIASLEQGLRRRPYPYTLKEIGRALQLEPDDCATLRGLATTLRSKQHARPGPDVSPPPPGRNPGHNLPVAATPLIGREIDIASVSALLAQRQPPIRLVTLVGPGGVGKTRLALAAAVSVAPEFADRVVFVDLAALHDHRLIPAAIAGCLRINASGGQSARELVFEYLRQRSTLLVLDNFEHLLSGAEFLGALLVTCQAVTVLATSRTALRVRAERRFTVEPLAPPAAEELSLPAIAASPAVQLFIERGQSVAPGFNLQARNAAPIAAICRRLDGMPLAIELAAARVGLLGPEKMLRRLDRQLELLTGGAPDLPERQRTLRNTLAWSYDLLGPGERMLLRRASVFAGGWTLSAVEAVCGNSGLGANDILEPLEALVDNNLIRRLDKNEDEPRFGMLESVREYAAEKLLESGEFDALRCRYVDWCLALAERGAIELTGPSQANWLERLDRALDNLRVSLAWLHEHQQTQLGLQLTGALGRFWSTRRHVAEGREWVERFLSAPNAAAVPAAVRARACYAAGVLASIQADTPHAVRRLEESIELHHLAGDMLGAVRALNTRGGVSYDVGQLAFAAALWEQTLAQARAIGDLGEASHAVGNLGEAHFHMGDVDGAVARHSEALALARQCGRTDVEAMQLGDLGNAVRARGDLARAISLQRQALVLKRELGARRQIAITLADFASLAGVQGRGQRAARLVGAAMALRELIGTPQPVPERADMETSVATVRAAVGEAAWNSEFNVGHALTMDQAIEYALE